MPADLTERGAVGGSAAGEAELEGAKLINLDTPAPSGLSE
jgi:hypothetical protein